MSQSEQVKLPKLVIADTDLGWGVVGLGFMMEDRGMLEEEAVEVARRAEAYPSMEVELLEQARLLGMGGSREAALISERDTLKALNAELVEALEETTQACGLLAANKDYPVTEVIIKSSAILAKAEGSKP